MSRLFVGVDGGGSGSRALVTDAGGRELGRADGPPAAVDPTDPAAAVRAALRTVRSAVEEAGGELPAASLCAALAGAGGAAERAAVEEGLREAGAAERVRATTDAEAALEDAFGPGPGVVLVAGTGSCAWARGRDGRTARAGGWGPVAGDEGSGYDLGRRALRAATRAADGRGPPTRLLQAALAATGSDSVRQLARWAAEAERAEAAALAPRVVEAAAAGDPVASRLVSWARAELVNAARAAAAGAGLSVRGAAVALAGGLVDPGGPLRPEAAAALRDAGFRVLTDAVDGARGAARLARDARRPGKEC